MQAQQGEAINKTLGPTLIDDNPVYHPTIFIYDNFPGGIGLSRPLFEVREQLLNGTQELIRSCACEDGCPSCVGPAALAKEVALAILESLHHA